MPHLTRRHLLASTVLMVPVAGCAGLTAAQIASDAVTYGPDIANALLTVVGMVTTVPANVATDVQTAETVASQIVAGMTQTAAAPLVTQIGNALTDAASALTSGPTPIVKPGSTAATILADAQLAMPLLQIAVGLLTAGATLGGPTPAQRMTAAARLHALPRAAQI
jgi:hypothetical protein